jgi:hypothetical protein
MERNFENGSNQGISVKNNRGAIDSRFKWLKGTYPNYVVKTMNNGRNGYSEYNEKLKGIVEVCNEDGEVNEIPDCVDNCHKNVKHVYGIVKDVSRVSENGVAMDYGEYLQTKLKKKICLPQYNPDNESIQPCPVVKSGLGVRHGINGCNSVCNDGSDACNT